MFDAPDVSTWVAPCVSGRSVTFLCIVRWGTACLSRSLHCLMSGRMGRGDALNFIKTCCFLGMKR